MTPACNPRIRDIQHVVAGRFGITVDELLSDRRMQAVAHPRQVAMYLAKTMTLQSLPKIGRAFRRDHTTIMHGVRRIEGLMERDQRLAGMVESLKALVPLRPRDAMPGHASGGMEINFENTITQALLASIDQFKNRPDMVFVCDAAMLLDALGDHYGEQVVQQLVGRTGGDMVLTASAQSGTWTLLDITAANAPVAECATVVSCGTGYALPQQPCAETPASAPVRDTPPLRNCQDCKLMFAPGATSQFRCNDCLARHTSGGFASRVAPEGGAS